MQLVRIDHCLFFKNRDRDDTFRHIKIRARESKISTNDGLITLKCFLVSLKIVVFSLGTSLRLSNNTIALYRIEFSLNTRRMTVIGTYSSKLYTLYILYVDVAWTIAAKYINIVSTRWGMSWYDHIHYHPNWQPRWICQSWRGLYVFSYLKS